MTKLNEAIEEFNTIKMLLTKDHRSSVMGESIVNNQITLWN